MRDKLYDNADSFAMSFDEEWEKIDCEDLRLKIDKVFELFSDIIVELIKIKQNRSKYAHI